MAEQLDKALPRERPCATRGRRNRALRAHEATSTLLHRRSWPSPPPTPVAQFAEPAPTPAAARATRSSARASCRAPPAAPRRGGPARPPARPRIARAAHGAPRGVGELVLAAVAAVGGHGGGVPARLALRDRLQDRRGTAQLGGARLAQPQRGERLRADDAVDRRARGGAGSAGSRGGSAGRRCRRPGCRARAATAVIVAAWEEEAAPPLETGDSAEGAAGQGERGEPGGDRAQAPAQAADRRRAASALRARERRWDSSHGACMDGSVIGTTIPRWSRAYGVSCRARARPALRRPHGGDSPREPVARSQLGPPLPPPCGGGTRLYVGTAVGESSSRAYPHASAPTREP